MKKIKLQFKYDELHAVYGDLFNNAMPKTKLTHIDMMVVSLLTQLYTKLAGKVLFRTDKKIKINLDVATACALLEHVNKIVIDHANYTHNVYIRIVTDIHQQLS